MKKLIITGRIFDKNILIGYKAWIVDTNILKYLYINKSNLSIISQNYIILNCEYVKSTNSLTSSISIPIVDFPRYNKNGLLLKRNRYRDSIIIAKTLQTPVEDIRFQICGALISGAISDVNSKKALKHADLYYDEIRHMTSDVKKIANRTGYSEKEIIRIKNYLFMEQHNLDGELKRFDSSFEIAQTWQRLMTSNMEIQHHDIVLLEHELFEISLVDSGLTQDEAHIIASQSFNYEKESAIYYGKIR